MTITTFSVTLTRTDLSLADLEINEDPYQIQTIDPGGMTNNRVGVRSAFVEGEAYVHETFDNPDMQVVVWVTGADIATLKTNLTTLADALSQRQFVVTMTIDGTAFAWTGHRGDYRADLRPEFWHTLKVPVTITFPRYAIADDGPL